MLSLFNSVQQILSVSVVKLKEAAAQPLVAADRAMCDQKRIVDGVLRKVGPVVFRRPYARLPAD